MYPAQRRHSHFGKCSSILTAVGLSRYEGDNFVLDQQVVRAALKSYKMLFSAKHPSAAGLSPFSHYLRLLLNPTTRPQLELSDSPWEDPATLILLLEWRAAKIVQELAQNQLNTDASINQRVSKAVTEAFVVVQVGEMIGSLPLGPEERAVVGDLYRLVIQTNPHLLPSFND